MFTLVCSTEQQPVTISLMETNMKRKAEWVADLSQCIANERHHKLLTHIRYCLSIQCKFIVQIIVVSCAMDS